MASNPLDQLNQYSLTSFLKDLKQVEKEKVVNKEENVRDNTLQEILGLNNDKNETVSST